MPEPPELAIEDSSEVDDKGKVEAEKENKKISRDRKAKETQKRLGVGRPKVAGGTGPRVVTKLSTTLVRASTRRSRTQEPSAPTSQSSQDQPPPEQPAKPKEKQSKSRGVAPSLEMGTYLHLDALIEEPEGEAEASNVTARGAIPRSVYIHSLTACCITDTTAFPIEALSFTADSHRKFASLASEQAQSSTPGPSRPRSVLPSTNIVPSYSGSSQDTSGSAIAEIATQIQQLWERNDSTVSKLSSHDKETISLRDDLNVLTRNQQEEMRTLAIMRRGLAKHPDKGKGREEDREFGLGRIDWLEDKVASLEEELAVVRAEGLKQTLALDEERSRVRKLEETLASVLGRLEGLESSLEPQASSSAIIDPSSILAPPLLGKRSLPLDSPFTAELDDRPEPRFKRRRVASEDDVDPHTPPSHHHPLSTELHAPRTPMATTLPGALHEPQSPTTESPRRGEKGKGKEKEIIADVPKEKKAPKTYRGFDPDTRIFHPTSGTPAFPPVSPYYTNGVPRLLPAWNYGEPQAPSATLSGLDNDAPPLSPGKKTLYGTEAERFEGVFGEYGEAFDKDWLSGRGGGSGAAWGV
jgi:hypothetical protein